MAVNVTTYLLSQVSTVLKQRLKIPGRKSTERANTSTSSSSTISTMKRLSVFLLLFFFPACTALHQQCDRSRVSSPAKFSYDNGAAGNWGTTSTKNKICNNGHAQSPINVVVNYSTGAMPIIAGNLGVFRFQSDTHNFKLNCAEKFGDCGHVSIGGKDFSLLQFHAHSPSENYLSGEQFPLELHFVHASYTGELAVVGVLFRIGEFNREFERFLDSARNRHYAVIDVEKLSKTKGANVCTFLGSLTTPPCSENVSWILSLNIATASLRQIGEYREMCAEKRNNRPLMPLNRRQIKCYAGAV